VEKKGKKGEERRGEEEKRREKGVYRVDGDEDHEEGTMFIEELRIVRIHQHSERFPPLPMLRRRRRR